MWLKRSSIATYLMDDAFGRSCRVARLNEVEMKMDEATLSERGRVGGGQKDKRRIKMHGKQKSSEMDYHSRCKHGTIRFSVESRTKFLDDWQSPNRSTSPREETFEFINIKLTN
ncbi:hypothetical protein CEXT_353691 [Caerostris extrusa]|uniref:Uncharacterized protein n=1 Tax=Caerostris extrusa TaxID=172846 RepID=A0AAV4QSZ1_CAEEX|nr:hypothetical protein CEXT_353691 [Caerostris extrusa]